MTDAPPTILDSGERRQFEGGAVRDRGEFKPRPDLISPHANMREGAILAAGAEKYDLRNWEQGMPISECFASAMRHMEKYKLGCVDEDHLAMARTNLGFMLHFEEEIKAGGLGPKWDDMPKYAIRWDAVSAVQPESAAPLLGVTATELIAAVEDRRREKYREMMGRMGYRKVLVNCKVRAGHQTRDDWTFGCEYRMDETAIPTADEGNRCYIAGPMRGIDEFNFPSFDLARDMWAAKGWSAISPADMDREHGLSEKNPPQADVKLMREVMSRDCKAILGLCPGSGDCLLVLPGWEKSKGSAVEVALARFMGLPVVRAFDGEVVPE